MSLENDFFEMTVLCAKDEIIIIHRKRHQLSVSFTYFSLRTFMFVAHHDRQFAIKSAAIAAACCSIACRSYPCHVEAMAYGQYQCDEAALGRGRPADVVPRYAHTASVR